MKYPQACVIIFSKEPVPGKVKTRLIPSLGAEGACRLHQRLLARLLNSIKTSKLCHYQLWVNNNPEHEAFADFAGERRLQQGKDLGERMHHAAESVLQEFRYVVIIGTDCPQIDDDYLQQAITALTQDNNVVLGPAEDGGYVLIGLSSAEQAVFEGIAWSSSQVLQQTRETMVAEGLKWQELATYFDIDHPEDLIKLKPFGIAYQDKVLP